VAYFTGSQAIGSSANLFWDNTQGFLGVATATPTATIEAVKTDGIGIYANFTTNVGTGSNAFGLYAKNVTNSSGYAAVIEETTPNTTAGQYPLLVKHSLSSGTAGVGMGTGIHFQLPDDAGTFKTTQLTIETIDAAAATYATRYRFMVQSAGSSTPAAYLNATGLGIKTATPLGLIHADGGASAARIILDADSGVAKIFSFRTDALPRWAFRVDGAETGSNAGADLSVRSYDDTGALLLTPISIIRATGESTFSSTKTYSTGNAIGIAVQHNLTIPNGVNVGLAALGGVNSNLNLTLGGSTTVAATGRQGLEGSTSISFTGAGTLTMTQGSTVRAFSALSSVYAFNGSAVGTITHLAGLRICFPNNPGSAVNITNNYALLINDQTTGTGTVTYTNRWGIYQEGASDLNYFAGNSLYGTTTNVGAKISIAGYMYISNRPLAQIVFNSTGTYYGQIQNDAADKWSFARNTVNDGTLGTPIMTWDAATLSVGIGTINPNSLLQLTAAAGTSHARWTESATTVGFVGGAQGIITGLNGSFAVRAESGLVLSGQGNAANLYINSSGNVGIGTTSPSQKLEVNGISLLENIQIGTTSAFLTNSVNAMIGWASSFSGYSNGTLILQSRSSAATPIVFATGSTSAVEQMRITSGGNVGIGTQSPAGYGTTLQIAATSANDASFVLGDGSGTSTNRYLAARPGSSADFIFGTDAGNIRFHTGLNPGTSLGTERARILAGGNFLIGTTTDAGQKLQVEGVIYSNNNTTNYLNIYSSGTNDSGLVLGNGTSPKLYVYKGNDDRFEIYSVGRTGSAGAVMQINYTGTEVTFDTGSIKTAAPTTGTAARWKLGSRVAATVVVNTTEYIEVDIGGTLYKLATVT
jgi:hypothetical protein